MRDKTGEDQKDRASIRSVLEGNKNAFRRLFVTYQPAVAAVGRKARISAEDLRDFVQEVFLKAFSRLEQYSGTGRFYSWLMRIAYTTAINLRERAVPEVATDPGVLARMSRTSHAEGPERVTEGNMLLNAIGSGIRELPKQLATSVELFFVFRLRYAEINQMTGVPVNTLKSHIYRGRQLLQERLTPFRR
ncbi:MAG: RNA polymerase sigma factor [Spirochaetaceae bacterium]